jgi:hypothetical protein
MSPVLMVVGGGCAGPAARIASRVYPRSVVAGRAWHLRTRDTLLLKCAMADGRPLAANKLTSPSLQQSWRRTDYGKTHPLNAPCWRASRMEKAFAVRMSHLYKSASG